MLGVNWSEENEGITVPYPAMSGDHHGFLDLRGHPDLVETIPEAANSNGLRVLLRAAAVAGAPVVTIGCELGGAEKAPDGQVIAGGYVHVLARDHATLTMPVYRTYLTAVMTKLREASGADHWAIQVIKMPVRVLLDCEDRVSDSFVLNFHAFAPTIEAGVDSRERLLVALSDTLLGEAADVLPLLS